MPFDGKAIPDIAKRLIEAKAYLIDHGWCQGVRENGFGQVCAAGAIYATGGYSGHFPALYALAEANEILQAAVGDWNDIPGRTVNDIITAFDRAIEIEMVKVL